MVAEPQNMAQESQLEPCSPTSADIAILAVPHQVPGFVVPGSSGSMHAMGAMDMSR